MQRHFTLVQCARLSLWDATQILERMDLRLGHDVLVSYQHLLLHRVVNLLNVRRVLGIVLLNVFA